MLIQLTGCVDPTDLNNPEPRTNKDPGFQAARFLAQLAVNIVDYVDEDDVITQWQWYKRGAVNGYETVYGTEIPRLVLNEVFCTFDNDINDPKLKNIPANLPLTASQFNMNFWVELHNTFKQTTGGASYPSDGGNAYLIKPNAVSPIYQLLICSQNSTLGDNNPENVKGDPDTPSKILSTVNNFQSGNVTGVVLPMVNAPFYGDSTRKNVGFYVLGPKIGIFMGDRDPGFPPLSYTTDQMTVKNQPLTAKGSTYDILLQRLANPNLPY